MEARDRFKNDEKYKMPLTVFDVVRIQKLSEISAIENEVRPVQKDEEPNKEFCSLNDLF